jgi:hypothetical protein
MKNCSQLFSLSAFGLSSRIFKRLVRFLKIPGHVFPPWSAQYGMALKNNAMPDVITQIYPWKKITIDSWKQGQVPLWNPYSFSGTPHAANYQTAVFSPVNLLYFILPFLEAWSIMILLQPLFGIIHVFLAAGSKRSKPTSLIGSIALCFVAS